MTNYTTALLFLNLVKRQKLQDKDPTYKTKFAKNEIKH